MSMIFGLMVFGQSARTNQHSSNVETAKTYHFNQAKNIAQSAAMVVIHKIIDRDDEEFKTQQNETIFIPDKSNTGYLSWNDTHGKYQLEIENQGDTLLFIQSIGKADAKEYTVTATMTRTSSNNWNPNLPWTIFAKDDLSLTGNTEIKGNVATNATENNKARISGNSEIDGSLAIGPGGVHGKTVTQNGNAEIKKGIYNLPAPMQYDLPEFPEFPSKANVGSPVVANGNSKYTLSYEAYEGTYIPKLRVSSNAQVTILTGNKDRILHVGELLLNGNADLNIDGDGKLEIMIEDEINIGGNNKINRNNNNSQEKLMTFYKGDSEVKISGNSEFNGSLYAKDADIKIGGNDGIYGHLITGGENVKIGGNGKSRVLYAPNAEVKFAGNQDLIGSIVSKSLSVAGNYKVIFSEDYDGKLPDIKSEVTEFELQSWY